jgi:hypothetical protein
MSCDVQTEFPEEFLGGIFENTEAIEFMHNTPPRYGHSSDINLLINGSESEQEDYLRGLLASSITIFWFFMIWMFFVWVFKCMGPYAVGIFSGRRVPLPAKPRQADYEDNKKYEEKLEKWIRHYEGVKLGNTFMKGLVLFAGLSIIVSSILLSVKG